MPGTRTLRRGKANADSAAAVAALAACGLIACGALIAAAINSVSAFAPVLAGAAWFVL